MTGPSTIAELTSVARGLGFEVICPGGVSSVGREAPLRVRLYGNEAHFGGTVGECAAFLAAWGTLRSRLLGELCAVEGQGSTEMSGQPSLRGSRGEVLPQVLVPLPRGGDLNPFQGFSSPEVPPARCCAPRGAELVERGLVLPLGMSEGPARCNPEVSSGENDAGVRALERLLPRDRRQAMIVAWAELAFGREEATGLPQRSLRLLEEAIEMFQACGGAAAIAHERVTFMFKRPGATIGQELGGVAVALLALAAAAGLSADAEECREIHRVLSKPVKACSPRNSAKNAARLNIEATTALEVL